jgi:hypothetical protein
MSHEPTDDEDEHVRLLLGLYVRGALDRAGCDTVERHLLRCAQCQDEHDGFSKVADLLGGLTAADRRRFASQLTEDDDGLL